jgi:putative tricarboxylic transport membrane protein
MNAVDGLMLGFSAALSVELLIAAWVGALAGTVIGVLPGLGPVAGAALILPLTYAYHPAVALIVIAAIYLGAQYGGSITSILLNIPGDSSAIVATFDGYPMAQKGRAGAALTITALGSFMAGTLGLLIMLITIPFVMSVALSFRSAEFFALTAGGLLLLTRISGGSLASGLFPMIVGVALGTVGAERTESYYRFTFGHLDLSLGIALASVAVGLFGISEMMMMLEEKSQREKPRGIRMRELVPTRAELRRALLPWTRGSVIGFIFGLLPGPSALLSTFASYKVEQMVARDKTEFGQGAVEGLAGPEAANNAAAIGGVVPLLLLGLPFSATLALMLSAMTVHGIQSGPLLMLQNPDIFWAVIAAMFVANAMLLVLNLPLIGLWVRMLSTPLHILIPIIVVIALIGSFSINNNMIDIRIMLVMGLVGYLMRKLDFSLPSLLVGMVLGPLIERYFLQGMYQARGDLLYFFSSPIALTIWMVVIAVLLSGFITPWLKRRSQAFRHLSAMDDGDR